jgi:IS5 family transposase
LKRDINPQQSFIDNELFERMVPKDHPLVKINQSIDFSFVAAETDNLYSKSMGRPGWPPEILFRILYLEYWANLSDVQVCRDLQYNVLYRWFCKLDFYDATPDDTTLVVFRRKLKEANLHEKFLNQIVAQAKEKKLLGGRWAIVDGTKIRTFAATRGHINFLRHGRHKIFAAAVNACPELSADNDLKSLLKHVDDSSVPNHDALAAAERDKGILLLEKLRDIEDNKTQELISLFESALSDDGTCSFVDPDARWGHQKANEPFCGYKTVAACDESGIVTAASVVPGNESELPQAFEVMDKVKDNDIKPKAFAADAGYESNKLKCDLIEDNIQPYVPGRNRPITQAADFILNSKSEILYCPMNKKSVGRTAQKKGYTYYFSTSDCRYCPIKDQCLTDNQLKYGRKQIFVDPLTEKHRPRGMKQASRIRKTIERVFGDAKYWHDMEQSRYVGLAGTTFHVFMTFIVVNTKKMSKMLSPVMG